MELLLIFLCVLTLTSIILTFVFRPKSDNSSTNLLFKLDDLISQLNKLTDNIKDDFRTNREEILAASKDNRTELSDALSKFKIEMTDTLKQITDQGRVGIEQINKTLTEKFDGLIVKVDETNKAFRETVINNLKDFSSEQRNKLDEMKEAQKDLSIKTAEQLDKIIDKIETKLGEANEQVKGDGMQMRKELKDAFTSFNNVFKASVEDMKGSQIEKLTQLKSEQSELTNKTEQKLSQLNEQTKKDNNEMREALINSFKGFQNTLIRTLNLSTIYKKKNLVS